MDDKAGAIEEPHDHDLICGRGGKVNAHPGNRRFRSWVNDRKEAYTRAQAKGEKNAIAQSILEALFSQNPPGRVLQFDEKNGMYSEVSFKKAMSKTTQALREGAPELRKKKGLPPPKELSKAKKATLSMSSVVHRPSGGRPKIVHIKATGGFLENDAEHEYDASSYSSGSVDSGYVAVKVSGSEHTDVDGISGPSRKHDHFSHRVDTGAASNETSGEYDYDYEYEYEGFGKKKKPRIVGAASSDEESSSKKPASPPINDSASLLYALAATCAKQAPSPSIESPPASNQGDTPCQERLVTPETGSSRRLWTTGRDGAASIDTSYPSYASLTSSAALTTSNKLRLQKEKIVQSFLITSLPSIYMDDVEAYSARLVDDGFDSLQMLMEQLEEDDLDFMKKAHKRALLQVIQKET